MEADTIKQDMPPRGGYAKILYQRTFPKTWVNWRRITIGIVGAHFYIFWRWRAGQKRRIVHVIEDNDVHVALEPFLMAERDRLWLHTLHRLREEEREAMKNVPGWKVGTWYGEPMYFTIPPEKWWDPLDGEVFSQSRELDRWLHDHLPWQEWESAPHWYHKYFPSWWKDVSKLF